MRIILIASDGRGLASVRVTTAVLVLVGVLLGWFAVPAHAQPCTDGTYTYAEGAQAYELRSPGTAAATIATRQAQGWTLASNTAVQEPISGVLRERRVLVFRCPVPPTPIPPPVVTPAPVADGAHSYFSSLLWRPDAWKAYTLRDQAQLDAYKAGRTAPPSVVYDAAREAAAVNIPTWNPTPYATLARPLTATDTYATLAAPVVPLNGAMTGGSALRVDGEILTVMRPAGSTLTDTVQVLRGQHETAAVAHAANALVERNANSLITIVRLPLGTQDGHTYLITWDSWLSSDFLDAQAGLNHYKHFQFGTNGTRWFEIRTLFRSTAAAGDLGLVDARGYLNGRPWSTAFGPNIPVGSDGTLPTVATWYAKPNVWTRYWVLIDQRAGDYDRVSLWVADETRDPVLLCDALQLDAPLGLDSFWLEYSTSVNTLGDARRDLVAYVRNLIALRDVPDPVALMQRPIAPERP